MGGSWSQTEMRDEVGNDPGEGADNSRQHQQWQMNLLDHIDAVQDDVSHRMDFIERELYGKSLVCNVLFSGLGNYEGSFSKWSVGWNSGLYQFPINLKNEFTFAFDDA